MGVLCVALNPAVDVTSDVARVMPTRKMRTRNQRQEAGGGAVNVARMIAELGGDPDLLICSGGATGALLEDMLSSLPIRVDVVRTAEMTRISFMVHEEETNLEYRFVPEGPVVRDVELAEVLAKVTSFRGDLIVGSGSLPRGVPEDTYARMAAMAASNGARFILDTSGKPLSLALEQGGLFLVKPSLTELGGAVGRDLTAETAGEAAMSLVTQGRSQYVAATLGSDGALLASADGVYRLPAESVMVRSAVGAGDAFLGAFVWSLLQGATPVEAFRWGVAAGGAAVMTPGMELARKADVLALHSRLAK